MEKYKDQATAVGLLFSSHTADADLKRQRDQFSRKSNCANRYNNVLLAIDRIRHWYPGLIGRQFNFRQYLSRCFVI